MMNASLLLKRQAELKPSPIGFGAWLLRKPSLLIYFTLFGYFVLQAAFSLTPAALSHLQRFDIYKETTGFLLAVLILQQWYVGRRYRRKPNARERLRRWHRNFGNWTLFCFLLHSSQPGYGYQVVLCCAFLGVGLVGHLHPRVLGARSVTYFNVWLFFHVCLAILICTLMAYHLYVTYSY